MKSKWLFGMIRRLLECRYLEDNKFDKGKGELMIIKGLNLNRLWDRLAILAIIIPFVITACASGGTPSASTTVESSSPVEVPTPSQSGPATEVPSGMPSSSSAGNLVFSVVPDQSTVNYRVREQLASVDLPSDAPVWGFEGRLAVDVVGKTNAITGKVTIQPDGTILPAESQLVVEVSTLKSDRDMRDNFLRRNILQTSQYPQVTFVPTQVSGLSTSLPQSGNFTFQLTGDLTIRDVTKQVTWDVSGEIQGGQITAQASTSFTFEDFNLTQPKVPVVLSVEDHITLEASLVLQQENS